MENLTRSELEKELKQTRQKLLKYENQIKDKEKFLSLAEQLPVAIVEMNSKMEITFINSATERAFGYTLDEVKGDIILNYMHKKDWQALKENVSLIFKGEFGIPNRYTAINSDKKPFEVIILSTPLLKDGKADGIRSCIVDYSHYKILADERLKEANKETVKAYKLADKLKKELREHTSLGDLVSSSKEMKNLFQSIKMVADLPTTVLISGETGCGKELVAKQIHKCSSRSDLPLVTVNCGALPDNLLESELFGYMKGAFTDAKEDKKGLFEQTNGGTIFLDEIGEMPMSMQIKLLRVIQEKKIMPIGSAQEKDIDIRIIAATNKDLEQMVEENTFREDLYYRIKVVHLKVPPLRYRKVDIPPLTDLFIEHFNTLFSKKIRTISKDALNLLLKYDFPGNVRELKHIIEYACIFCETSIIEPDDLSEDFKAKIPLSSDEITYESPAHEKNHLIEEILASGGNKSEAARKLGIHKTTLFRRLRKHNITDDMLTCN